MLRKLLRQHILYLLYNYTMPGNLTHEKTGDNEISLFSLELVVEKVYIPHSPCKFPAIAFRLLDFPTIVIKHVEDDLAKAIRDKVSADPYYQVPNQFIELKDKHGNFMIKKGKSCLFKMSANVLKQHLASTPLYVMIIDLFPEVPKLIGNSSIPLNSMIESICIDIIKLGSTVPSVHGDKGLFKIYNLMGKEIGYFVLGFRLLCLGPSLIPHLPESSLVHQDKTNDLPQFDQFINKHELHEEEKKEISTSTKSSASSIRHKHSSSMTEPVQQTVEKSDKETLVKLDKLSSNHAHSASTQTERKLKEIRKPQDTINRWIQHIEPRKDDNDLIINNIICPPPMFYNSEASPALQMQIKSPLLQFDENLSVNELSDIDSFDGFGLHNENLQKADISKQESLKPSEKHYMQDIKKVPKVYIPQARDGEIVKGLNVAPQSEAVFPLLTALIKELSCIQNPQLLLDVSNKLQATSTKSAEQQPTKVVKPPLHANEKLPLSVVSAVATALTKKLEASKQDPEKDYMVKKASVQQKVIPTGEKKVGKNEKDSRKPKMSKGKLVFGLTNTQRLRLKKTNPQWLELAEKEATELRAQLNPMKKALEMDDMNATTFSDTLTEVRRLAEKELNTTAALGDTLQNVASEVELESMNGDMEGRHAHKKLQKKSSKPHKDHGAKSKHLSKSKHAKQSLSSILRDENKQMKKSSNASAGNLNKKADISDDEDHLSAHSEALSSRSRSIEVRLPSAEPEFKNISGADNDSFSESDEDIPLPDDSVKDPHKSSIINFSKYLSRSSSNLEPIPGVANASVDISSALDENSPLESTRHSKSAISEKNDSRNFQSTDYDTHQYLSTDEPELQGLMSEEVNVSGTVDTGRKSVNLGGTSQKFPVVIPQLSESSPVPSVRRSHTKIDLSHLVSTSLSKDHNSPTSSKAFSPKGKQETKSESYRLNPQDSSRVTTPKITITPRSVSSSPRQAKAPPRKALRESIHTDSISSYMPSDPDNVIVSLSTSNSGNYSEDFLQINSGNSNTSSVEQLPNIISSAKLGYTIN